ncbi:MULTISPECIES: zinc-binding dehydrogenase [unclassified Corynebacterium]|uniref:zinc-binding dehydrogenase n=1 Tax=Corynebacterium TaxID=1716 RepID=UPI00254BF822|nr:MULTISPECIES: zinc-binding dehydrogenase [unclassified Corynebacterium]MDK8475068.1 zinc-binding dehydrogenase [Corynebacterium sp. MSK310]MDK8491071.1 zinc-binding dehydrogenase [Corynebacterium sp. MSK175]MDK8646757.1 zinc-binding dehydrogenase [Corynebacterium sp. MSK082]MDK8697430.1 zinc-binding dehydrogenase [Corynebacterium sp. MSK192]
MLVAALVLALVAFVALVTYVLNTADWALYLVFIAAGSGIILFIIDWACKYRTDNNALEEDLSHGWKQN